MIVRCMVKRVNCLIKTTYQVRSASIMSSSDPSCNQEELKRIACSAIDAASSSLHDVSKSLHANPELCFEERHAHKLLTTFLGERGFTVDAVPTLDTAFRAERPDSRDTSKVPHVAMICEYDALPDIGHACGHNLIAEVGLGAALGVKAALDSCKELQGKLLVLGTPAEEGGAGKCLMIDQGTFDDVDIAMMSHPAPSTTSTPDGFLCIQPLTVTFLGKASHAAGFPWEGINALDAAVMAYSNVSCMRQQMKPSWRVHGIITEGGTKPNIIPERATLSYYVRTPNLRDLSVLKEKIEGCMHAAASATGCKVELEWTTEPRLNIITNKLLAGLYEDNAKGLGVTFEPDRNMFSGSTDMGNVSYKVPSIHPLYYIGEEVFNHTKPFTTLTGSDKAQSYTLDQAKALAMTAIDIMCKPQLVAEMKAELHSAKQAALTP